MVAISLYFHIHHPLKLKNYRIFDIGHDDQYFDVEYNKNFIQNLSKSYIKSNRLFLDLIKKHEGKFKLTFSISGTMLEQIENYSPELLDTFKDLAKTGCIDFLSETYYHSLSFLYSREEFKRQIELHKQAIVKHFNIEPKVFKNTELIYNNELSKFVEDLGYRAIICDSSQRAFTNKDPNFIYTPKESQNNFALIIKNNSFSNYFNENKEINLENFSRMINLENESNDKKIINLFYDYSIFDENESKKLTIYDFFKSFPDEILRNDRNTFVNASDTIENFKIKEKIDIPFLISESLYSSLDSYIGNKMQKSAMDEIFELEKIVKKTKNKDLIKNWRKLTISDNFYYMNTSLNIKNYLYNSPYDAYVYYMNSLNDLIIRIKLEEKQDLIEKEILNTKISKNLFEKIKGVISN